jgi:hypothetical protein
MIEFQAFLDDGIQGLSGEGFTDVYRSDFSCWLTQSLDALGSINLPCSG